MEWKRRNHENNEAPIKYKKILELMIMRIASKRRLYFTSFNIFILLGLLYFSGLYQYFLVHSFAHYYVHWGPNIPFPAIIGQMQRGEKITHPPINEFSYPFTFIYHEKCRSKDPIKVLYVVKSALPNEAKRKTIRNSWGYENRFSDVIIRTVFLLGFDENNPNLQMKVEREANTHKDIIQAEFKDSYFNNTLKTMMGLYWTFHYCDNVKYFMFVDDDYYVSTRNILRFIRSPHNYPKYLKKYVTSVANEYQDQLYSGYVFKNVSPIRWYLSKWYVSLDEYPYSQWPPYVTGGSYILSRKSLVSLYYASLYTNFFRFDDIFLGMAALKAGIQLLHHPNFHFNVQPYSLENYKWVIAAHGFDDPILLQNIWNEQRSAGNA